MEPWPRVLHISGEDMKPRYQPLSQKQDHVESYLKSLRHSSYVVVEYKLMRCNIAEFKIITDLGGRPVSTEKKKSVTEYLQGEFCDPEAQKKYVTPIEELPHQEVRDKRPSREAWVKKLTLSNVEQHEMEEEPGPYELRQFACPKCDNYTWWRTVPKRKPVSRCHGGKCHAQRYDPLPRDMEFGIGQYHCSNCDRFFYGHCEATDVLNCRKCSQPCHNPVIHPKWRKKKRMANPANKTRRSRGRGEDGEPPFVPPQYPQRDHRAADQSEKIPVFHPSTPHRSTGSTISTCITQGDQISEHDLDFDNEIPDSLSYPRRFTCTQCAKNYTVKCKMTNMAPCFECGFAFNTPLGPSSADNIEHTTNRRHSCDECPTDGRGRCPNLA